MMKNNSSHPISKELFLAWKKFRESYAYTYEFFHLWHVDSTYVKINDAINLTLKKAILHSPLSEAQKDIATLLFFNHREKKTLIESGKATLEDFAEIRAVLSIHVNYYTRSEQEKRAFKDLFDNYYNYLPTPILILRAPLDLDTLRLILDNQNTLSKDEECIFSLFLLGELTDEELTNEERQRFISAADKVKDSFRHTDVEFYKQVAEFYITSCSEFSISQVCDDFNLNIPRFFRILRRYIHHNTSHRRSLRNFLDE